MMDARYAYMERVLRKVNSEDPYALRWVDTLKVNDKEAVDKLLWQMFGTREECPEEVTLSVHRDLMRALNIVGNDLKQMDLYFVMATGAPFSVALEAHQRDFLLRLLWVDSGADLEFLKF